MAVKDSFREAVSRGAALIREEAEDLSALSFPPMPGDIDPFREPAFAATASPIVGGGFSDVVSRHREALAEEWARSRHSSPCPPPSPLELPSPLPVAPPSPPAKEQSTGPAFVYRYEVRTIDRREPYTGTMITHDSPTVEEAKRELSARGWEVLSVERMGRSG